MAAMFERQCGACGAPVGGEPFWEKCGADQKALSFDRDVAQMLHAGALRSARNSLLWVAGLSAVGTLFAFAAGGGRGTVTLVVGLLVAAIYAGLWQWAKQQ